MAAGRNEEFAKTYWPKQDALGKRLLLHDGQTAEVVGVAKTGRYVFPTESPIPFVYLPYEQNERSRMTLIVESSGDPASLAQPLRTMVSSLDVDLPIQNLRTVASYYEMRVVSNFRVLLQVIIAMGIVGLIVAVVGLYGLIAYSVSTRTREIGVRMAIGASRTSVARLVLRQGLWLAGAGIAIGGLMALAIVPKLAASQPMLETMNIGVFAAVPAALLAASIAACYLPARRAAGLDPLRALRWD